MTVTLKPKSELTVPESIRRKGGYRPGDQVEFKVPGRTITIVPKPTPDEIEDEREIRNPKIRATIRQGYQEFLAGETRPAEALQRELVKIAESQAGGGKSVFRRHPKR
jgi:bifunctional DNA-binding transcriptional regulator/antitoxin component of YhaV-PrlF toxin-antitoxin module